MIRCNVEMRLDMMSEFLYRLCGRASVSYLDSPVGLHSPGRYSRNKRFMMDRALGITFSRLL